MVDTRGAVLLDALVPTVEVDTGQDAPLLGLEPGFAAALRLLFAASVLQAFAIHVSRERGERFDVDTRDIGTLTVAQLASLFRQHDGTAGQGFELAVADAINLGVTGVVGPIQQALAGISVPMTDPRSVVMGLEKTADPQALARRVADAVGDRTLRTGRRGGQPLAAPAVERLLAGGTAIRGDRGALALADLLVYDAAGPAVVTTSVKIRPYGFITPADPPRLWITTGNPDRLREHLPPRCAVAGVGSRELTVYLRAHDDVVMGLHAVDVGGRDAVSEAARVLRRRRRATVAQVRAELVDRAADRADAAGLSLTGLPALTERGLRVVTAEVPGEYIEYAQEQTASGLTVLRHRFREVTPHQQFFTRQLVA